MRQRMKVVLLKWNMVCDDHLERNHWLEIIFVTLKVPYFLYFGKQLPPLMQVNSILQIVRVTVCYECKIFTKYPYKRHRGKKVVLM